MPRVESGEVDRSRAVVKEPTEISRSGNHDERSNRKLRGFPDKVFHGLLLRLLLRLNRERTSPGVTDVTDQP
jgi:hypothetical protein